jgi:membrane protease YdiL (CAAX protease family)
METQAQAAPLVADCRPIAPAWHTGIVVLLIAAQALRGWMRADQLRAQTDLNRPAMYLITMAVEWLLLGIVLAGVWYGGSSLLTVLGDRWRSGQQFLRDAGIGVLFLIASIMVTSIFGSHSRGGDQSTQFLLPHSTVERVLWILLSIAAGICEEAVYRGYLQKQFIALTKSVAAGILVPAMLFGAAHSYQGMAKASAIAVLGAMGGLLAFWRRSVRPGMIAHVLQDVLGGFIRH